MFAQLRDSQEELEQKRAIMRGDSNLHEVEKDQSKL